MTARPILFSGPMIRALLEGRKTQTRRVVKPQPLFEGFRSYGASWAWHKSPAIWFSGVTTKQLVSKPGLGMYCPYGQPGDLLWVRETCCPDWADKPVYKADGGSAREAGYPAEPRWRPSIHMPRWASRLTLRITGVRVQRLHDISEDDAIAEGAKPIAVTFRGDQAGDARLVPSLGGPYRDGFRCLWASINGPGSWDANPWVWALTFEVIKANVDQVKP